MLESFRLGGWGMYPTLFFGAIAIIAALVYAMRPERRFVPIVAASSLLTLTSGLLGFVTGCIATAQYVERVSDQTLIVVGVGESLNNVALALVLIAFALLAVTLGALRIARVPAPARS